ncbi:MAG TPA: sulfatase-like hydrolase/transferase, partial [Firmicutes bacterium]|nr:sulfatase-like hydrolase/transferase [Bacillota bacterium]
MAAWLKYICNTLVRYRSVPLTSLLTFILVTGWPGEHAVAAERLPNIVWLVQDHVPWRQYTSTDGPKPVLAAFERLAAEGIVFEQARTVLPLCAPARASMMTGVLPHNHGVTTNDEVRVRNMFYPYYQPFNHYLRANDYVAAYFGKWHAGVVDAYQLGFQGYAPRGYGNPYETVEYRRYLAERGLPDPIVLREWHIAQQPW